MSDYHQVSQVDDFDEPLLNKPIDEDGCSRSRLFEWQKRRCASQFVAVILIGYSIMLFWLGWTASRHGSQYDKSRPIYSPALEAVEYKEVWFNGTLNHPSPFRGSPSPGVDRAWNYLMTNEIRASEEELFKVGIPKHPSLVKWHEADGGGYMVHLEFVHHLHCLNLLRKQSYRDYYETIDPLFQKPPEALREHIDHCIEMLRQNLMCYGDVGIISYEWVEGHHHPYPNFNTLHQCRDYSKLLDWARAHQIGMSYVDITRDEDVIDLTDIP